MPDTGTGALDGVLPARTDSAGRPGIDAADRRTASGDALCGRTHVEPDTQAGRPTGRQEARIDPDPAHGHSRALSQAEYQQTSSGAQGLSVSAAQSGDHPVEPPLGGRHYLHPYAARLCVFVSYRHNWPSVMAGRDFSLNRCPTAVCRYMMRKVLQAELEQMGVNVTSQKIEMLTILLT